MKYKNILTTAILAFASMALVSTSAMAETYQNGQVLLGFTKAGATGELTISAGAIAGLSLSGLTTLNHTFTIGNFNTQLTAALGASWYSTASFSAFGGDFPVLTVPGDTHGQMYISSASSAAPSSITGAASGTDVAIKGATLAYAQNGTGGTYQGDPTATGSYSSYMPVYSGSSTAWGGVSDPEATVNSNLYLDIYSLTTGSHNAITGANGSLMDGYFSVASNGDVSFNAVPEPSTYAMLGIGALFMGVVLRRKIKAANA